MTDSPDEPPEDDWDGQEEWPPERVAEWLLEGFDIGPGEYHRRRWPNHEQVERIGIVRQGPYIYPGRTR